jgi:hypothetical protein
MPLQPSHVLVTAGIRSTAQQICGVCTYLQYACPKWTPGRRLSTPGSRSKVGSQQPCHRLWNKCHLPTRYFSIMPAASFCWECCTETGAIIVARPNRFNMLGRKQKSVRTTHLQHDVYFDKRPIRCSPTYNRYNHPYNAIQRCRIVSWNFKALS